MTPTALQDFDDLVAGEAAGGRATDPEDVVTCAEPPVLNGGQRRRGASVKESESRRINREMQERGRRRNDQAKRSSNPNLLDMSQLSPLVCREIHLVQLF